MNNPLLDINVVVTLKFWKQALLNDKFVSDVWKNDPLVHTNVVVTLTFWKLAVVDHKLLTDVFTKRSIRASEKHWHIEGLKLASLEIVELWAFSKTVQQYFRQCPT